jgi:hypothetical protein
MSVTWMISAVPALRIRSANGLGSPKDNITAAGRCSSRPRYGTGLNRPLLKADAPGLAGTLVGQDGQFGGQPVLVPVPAAQ